LANPYTLFEKWWASDAWARYCTGAEVIAFPVEGRSAYSKTDAHD